MVSRLDVAMFNAIFCENGEEMPTDPMSNPISDSKILPIQAGKSSFGAGTQLKNAVSIDTLFSIRSVKLLTSMFPTSNIGFLMGHFSYIIFKILLSIG